MDEQANRKLLKTQCYQRSGAKVTSDEMLWDKNGTGIISFMFTGLFAVS